MREKEKVALAFAVIVAGQQSLSIVQDPANTKGDSIPLASVALASTDTGIAVWAPMIDTITDAFISFPPAISPKATLKSG